MCHPHASFDEVAAKIVAVQLARDHLGRSNVLWEYTHAVVGFRAMPLACINCCDCDACAETGVPRLACQACAQRLRL